MTTREDIYIWTLELETANSITCEVRVQDQDGLEHIFATPMKVSISTKTAKDSAHFKKWLLKALENETKELKGVGGGTSISI